jgi:glycosyltransferase involved in cell wall biosynthesis
MKNRILEALAMAKPVVTTPVGFEGLCLEPDKEIFVAATPELFANDVIRLLKDPQLRKDVGTAAREAVSRLYSWDSVTPRILAIYQSLMSRGSRRPI